jgi:hypothetical protein
LEIGPLDGLRRRRRGFAGTIGGKGIGRVTFTAEGRMMSVVCDGRAELPAGAPREYSSYSEVMNRLACAYDRRRVLVAGGASFIGSHLSELLVRSGAMVTVADYLSSRKLSNLSIIASNFSFLKGGGFGRRAGFERARCRQDLA